MDVAASKFYDDKDKTYHLNFKEEVDKFETFSLFLLNFHFAQLRYISFSNALTR